MANKNLEAASTTEGLPIAASLGPALQQANVPMEATLVDRRVVWICLLSIALAGAAACIAQGLTRLIWLITNLAFFARVSVEKLPVDFAAHTHLGIGLILVPVVGGLIVGVMARYGSQAIRGHGIPEAMEQVLLNQSRIPARMTFLKPLSAAVAIGTGGPFGAEGPIIATGGALGSLIGQLIPTTASERKTLLAAGAAAGMAATFGSPVSAVLLAVELLLFEFRPRSFIPVALASATAAGVRIAFEKGVVQAVFPMPQLAQPGPFALAAYIVIGAVVGVASVLVTRAVYAIEDAFEHLPVHWMWWPAIGAVAVGVIGFFAPRTLGVGYDNIAGILSYNANDPAGKMVRFFALLFVMKFISWSIALGSGTSGGTLAPLFTVGGGLGLLLGWSGAAIFPHGGIDPRIAALVGMAALFAGASRALLTSVVFAFETTLQPLGLLPLLGGCTASFFVSALFMRNTIMTEKIARRGVRVPAEYHADFLDLLHVREVMSQQVVSLRASQTLGEIRWWIASDEPGSTHQGYPIVDENNIVAGIATRRHLLDSKHAPESLVGELIARPPVIVYADSTLRAAADHMVNHDVGRLPVIERGKPGHVIGFITRSDLLAAHRRRLREGQERIAPSLKLRPSWLSRPSVG